MLSSKYGCCSFYREKSLIVLFCHSTSHFERDDCVAAVPVCRFHVFEGRYVEIAFLGRGKCGVCECAANRACIVAKYRVFLMSLGLIRPSCNDGGWVDWAGWVPLGLN